MLEFGTSVGKRDTSRTTRPGSGWRMHSSNTSTTRNRLSPCHHADISEILLQDLPRSSESYGPVEVRCQPSQGRIVRVNDPHSLDLSADNTEVLRHTRNDEAWRHSALRGERTGGVHSVGIGRDVCSLQAGLPRAVQLLSADWLPNAGSKVPGACGLGFRKPYSESEGEAGVWLRS